MRVNARRLSIDYIKPSIVNRGGRQGLAGSAISKAGLGSGWNAEACKGLVAVTDVVQQLLLYQAFAWVRVQEVAAARWARSLLAQFTQPRGG